MMKILKCLMLTLCVVNLAGCCSSSSCADAVTGATWQQPAQTDLPPPGASYTVLGVHPGLRNFAIQYDAHIYRGGQPQDETAMKTLRGWGIGTVISVTPSDEERAWCQRSNLELVEIPFDKTTGPSRQDLQRFLGTVEQGNGPYYVHCMGGTHRGGVLALAYRVHVQGWDQQRALEEYFILGGDAETDRVMIDAVLSF